MVTLFHPDWSLLALTLKRAKELTKVHDVTAMDIKEQDGIGVDIKRETKLPTLNWK